MASPHTMQHNGQANWMLMTAIHDALPLIGQIMSPRELSAIAKAIRRGAADGTVRWALAQASPHVRTQVLGQLPAPARFLYRRVWLPHVTRNTPPL